MSDKEKQILEKMAEVVKAAPASTKDCLLGWAEGAAAVACAPPSQEAERPGA